MESVFPHEYFQVANTDCPPRAVTLFAQSSHAVCLEQSGCSPMTVWVVSLMLVSNRVPSFSTSVPIISYNCFRISLSSFYNKTVLGHTYENTTYFSQFLIVGVTRREHLLQSFIYIFTPKAHISSVMSQLEYQFLDAGLIQSLLLSIMPYLICHCCY